MGNWIDTRDKLPENLKRVLLKVQDGTAIVILVGYLNLDGFEIDYELLIGLHRYYAIDDRVLAWAELPRE